MVSARYAWLFFCFAFSKAFTTSSNLRLAWNQHPATFKSSFRCVIPICNFCSHRGDIHQRGCLICLQDIVAVQLFVEVTITNLIVNHINSAPREILNRRTPYNIAWKTLGDDILKAFQIRPIAPDEANLTPKMISPNR